MDDWNIDEQLLDRCRRGDRHAMTQLYERHADGIIRFFRAMAPGDSEDLVQETFLRLFNNLGNIEDGRAVRGYILGIARRLWLEHLRSLERGRRIDTGVDSLAQLCPGVSSFVAHKQNHRLFLEGLRQLSIDDQTILALFYVAGVRACELATIAGIPASTARSRLKRAKERLVARVAALLDSGRLIDSTRGNLSDWANGVCGEGSAPRAAR